MASLRGVCLVLLTFTMWGMSEVSSSHIVFTSSSSLIKPLLTDLFTLRCSLRDGATTAVIGKRHAVSEVNSQGQLKSEVITRGQENDDVTHRDVQAGDVSFVHSLLITKDGADLASVTEHTAATVVNKTPDITVTGHIPGSGADKAVLEVSWKYPGPDQSGNYQCTVAGTDQYGHTQNFQETVEITDTGASMTDVVRYIQQLKLTNELQATSITSLRQSNDNQTSTIASLKQTIDLQAASIASLKQSNDLCKTTIDLHTSTIASLKQSNDLQDASITSLKHDIQTSSIANQSLAISDMEKELSELKKNQSTMVMFSAYLDHYVTASNGDRVVFNQVVTNVGNSYDPVTGLFTCHIPGYHVFDVHIIGQSDKYVGVGIYLNGNEIGYTFADDQNGYQSSSSYVTVVLRQGDKVEVKSFTTSYLYGGSAKPTTFSGHLVNLL